MDSTVRHSIRMVESFRRIRASAHFAEIHTMIFKGIPITAIVRKIQREWGEMLDVQPEALEKQLRRYKDSREGAIKKASDKPKGEGFGAIVASTMGRGEGKEIPALEKPMEARGAELEDAHEVIPTPLPTMFDSREEAIKLFALQLGRIKLGVACETEVSQLIPGMGLEVTVAKDLLKMIHLMDGDLGLRHQEPSKEAIAIGVGVTISPSLEEKLKGLGLAGVLSNEKSRSRIMAALRGVSSLSQGTRNPEMSENVVGTTELAKTGSGR